MEGGEQAGGCETASVYPSPDVNLILSTGSPLITRKDVRGEKQGRRGVLGTGERDSKEIKGRITEEGENMMRRREKQITRKKFMSCCCKGKKTTYACS